MSPLVIRLHAVQDLFTVHPISDSDGYTVTIGHTGDIHLQGRSRSALVAEAWLYDLADLLGESVTVSGPHTSTIHGGEYRSHQIRFTHCGQSFWAYAHEVIEPAGVLA